MTTRGELHTRILALLCRESSPTLEFIPFLPGHLQAALYQAAYFVMLANEQPGEAGHAAVLKDAEQQIEEQGLELVQYALRVFIAHHPEGRTLPQPSLLERAPWRVLPSRRSAPTGKVQPGSPGSEVWLDYFREDTGLNDFLDRWHIQYPATGHPDPDQLFQYVLPEGRGALFAHLHQQLLARYDTERLAFGLHRTPPLSDYVAPITEGYDSQLPGFSPRPPGQSLQSVPVAYDVKDLATRRDRLFAAASSGLLWRGETPIPIDQLELLANTAESNAGSVDGEAWAESLGPYGSLHNTGHVLLANLCAKVDLPGIMASPSTAARDPVFYRWHRHVDDIFDAWQRTHLPPHDLTQGPQVRMRQWLGEGLAPAHQCPDILLCLERDIPEAASPDFNGEQWGEATFGGASWDKPPPAFLMTSHTLRTRMSQHAVRIPDGREVLKPHLEHEPFFYFLRMENLLPREQTVTVRLFLVADAFAEERRLWMELDTFVHTLRPSQRAVLFRPSRQSSVVRRGWPAHLLLPRGRPEGMLFRLLVLLSEGTPDPEAESGEPGYPFNRPIRLGQHLIELVMAQPHVATRNLWIQHGP
jgi:hypothetical protein